MEPPLIEPLPEVLAKPPAEPRSVPALHGLLWLQQGFRMFTAQPGRWIIVLGVWLWAVILLPGVLTTALNYASQAALVALRPTGLDDTAAMLLDILPLLVPLVMVLLFPLVFAGLMIGCRAAAMGEAVHPRHLLAGFEREPARLVTVGGINAIGQILMSAVIAWLIRDRFGDLDLNVPDGPEAAAKIQLIAERFSGMLPFLLPVVVLQTLLMAALWFTPPLLAFHDMSPLAAVRASTLACARNAGSLTVYALAVMLMLSFVGAVSLSLQAGVLFGLLALGVLAAALTTVIGSVYVSYRDIFDLND